MFALKRPKLKHQKQKEHASRRDVVNKNERERVEEKGGYRNECKRMGRSKLVFRATRAVVAELTVEARRMLLRCVVPGAKLSVRLNLFKILLCGVDWLQMKMQHCSFDFSSA